MKRPSKTQSSLLGSSHYEVPAKASAALHVSKSDWKRCSLRFPLHINGNEQSTILKTQENRRRKLSREEVQNIDIIELMTYMP